MSTQKPQRFYTEFLEGINEKFQKLTSTTVTYFRSPLTIVGLKLGEDKSKYTPRVFFLSMLALFLITRKAINYIHDKVPGKGEGFNRPQCMDNWNTRLLNSYPDAQERAGWADFICKIREWVDADDLRINASIILLIVIIGILLVLFTWPLFGKTIKAGTLARNTLCSYAIGMLVISVYTILIGVVQLFSSFKEYGALDMTLFFILFVGLPLVFHIRIINMKRGKLSFGKGAVTVGVYVLANFIGCLVCIGVLKALAPYIDQWLKW